MINKKLTEIKMALVGSYNKLKEHRAKLQQDLSNVTTEMIKTEGKLDLIETISKQEISEPEPKPEPKPTLVKKPN